MSKFILSCESTVDVPYSEIAARDISVLFYSYTVDGTVYPDDMGRDPEALPRFYRFLSEGKLPQTSQLNIADYTEYFESLPKDADVLHIAFTSGQSGSVNNAYLAADAMREKYPDRRVIVLDSLCSSSGYGLLVNAAADLRDKGCDIDTVSDWVLKNRNRVHHQFFSTDMTQFRRTGRVSGAAALAATMLGICPIMRLDDRGRIIAYGKVRGKKSAIHTTVSEMKKHAQNGTAYAGPCYVCNSDCPEDAELLIAALEEEFPAQKGRIRLYDIGTIIGSHAGHGTVAVFFLGDERQPEEA